MQVCKTVKLRMRDRRNGTKSLFLDFWPGYRDPETMELIRRRSLGMYIYADPANKQQKLYNDKILAKAEAIRCKVYIDVLDEKYDFFNRDRLKEDFLGYFRNMVNRNYVKCDAAYKHFEKFSKGKCTFEMLDVLYCNKYMEYLLDTKVSSRGGHVIKKSISRNTASAYWNVFKQVLTKAYRERRLTDDLASLLENISCTTPVKQSLTLEEVRRMYATECSIPVVRKAALFSCLTGLRIDEDQEWFGRATGALGKKQLNDVALAQRLSKLSDLISTKYWDTWAELRTKVKIVNWSWETSYDGTAHGDARIVNTLPYSISGIKYLVTYYDRSGNFMAEDDGRVSKTLNPSEKYNFTFWSSNAKNPTTANLRLDFSDKTVLELMKEKTYTGKEFAEFIKKK